MCPANHTPSNAPISVSLMVENITGDFLAADEAGLKTVSISSATTPGTLDVATKVDDPDGLPGTFKVSIVEGAGYALPASASTSQVTTNVIDPTIYNVAISSSAVTNGITEGHSFEFTVSTLFDVVTDLPISVTITDENGDDLNPSLQGGNATITIPAGSRTAVGVVEMNLAADADGVDAATPGQIKVAVNATENQYRVIDNQNEILIPIKDADVGSETTPRVSLTGPALVVEGEAATYEISASHTPDNAPIMVSAMIANSIGSFLAPHQARMVQVPVSSSTTPGMFEIDTVADDPDSGDGLIHVSLVEGAGYALSREINDTTVSTLVLDPFIPPTLTITPAEPNVIEGRDAEYTITSSTPYIGELDVIINPVHYWGDYLDESDGPNGEDWSSGEDRTITVTFAYDGTNFKAPLILATLIDDNDSDGGSIDVTLKGDTNSPATYSVSTAQDANIAIMPIHKYPSPVVTIRTTAVTVVEGETAEITLEASENPERELPINYIPRETGTNYLEVITQSGLSKVSGQPRRIPLEFTQENPGSTDPWLAKLQVPTQKHAASGGAITIEITLPRGFTIGNPNMATITVNETTIPELTIADSPTTSAGDDALFEVTSDIRFVGNLNVIYRPVETGTSFLDESDGPNGEDWSSGEDRTIPLVFAQDGSDYTATLRLPTENDANSPSGGTINLTLLPDTADPVTYTISPIEDADSAEVSMIQPTGTPILTIADTTGPENANTANSVGKITFTISSNLTSAAPLMVRYQVSEMSGDFLDETTTPSQAAEQTKSLNFRRSNLNDPFTANLEVDIHDDNVKESTGQIKVTLLSDTEDPVTYLVASNGTQEAIGTIYDDDAPELSISAKTPSVTESSSGTTADFTISTEVSPNTMITAIYDLAESSDFIADGINLITNPRLDFTGGKKEVTFSVTVTNDELPEDNGTVTMTLKPDSSNPINYTVAASPDNSAVINVLDDESLPIVSIMADNGDVGEHLGQADFTLTATGLTSETTLMINATPSHINGFGLADFLANDVEDIAADYPVTFSDPDGDNVYIGILSIPIDDDNVVDIGFIIPDVQVTLNTPLDLAKATYKLGSTTMGTITVHDNEVPLLAIRATSSNITEGDNDTADFEIYGVASPDKLLTIRYYIIDSSFVNSDITTAENELDRNYQFAELDFTNGKTTATLSIPIVNDDLAENDGIVKVVFEPSNISPAPYTKDTDNDTAEVCCY